MVLLTGSFMLGAHFSTAVWGQEYVEKALEYSLVAWITCIILGLLLSYSYARGDGIMRPSSSYDEEEGRALLLGDSADAFDHADPDLPRAMEEESGHSTTAASSSVATPLSHRNVHPALDPYYIIDCHTLDRVSPNSTNLYKMDTDYFAGDMMVLIRTPDVDSPSMESPPANAVAVQHLRGKQRRFEFQFQVRLKKVPTGTVFFSCDLTQPIKLGMVQRAFVSAAMSFVRSSNPSFHYSIQGSTPTKDGSYERPHMAFPVQDGMNRVVATPPGQQPPRLGTVIEEDDQSLKRRKKGMSIEWNLENTYTFSLWSAYVDFLDWRVLNLPGIRPFGLNSVIGTQPIYLTLYEIASEKERHNRNDMIMIAEFEMSNSNVTGKPGPVAQKWFASRETRKRQTTGIERNNRITVKSSSAENISDPDSPLRASFQSIDMDDDLEVELVDDAGGAQDPSSADHDAEDAEAAAELGGGIYVRSGDAITLQDASDDRPNPAFVTMGGGFAVLQDQSSSTIIIEKAGRSRRGESGRSQLIRNGDTVLFKLVTKDRYGKTDEIRYLSIHRGWWLKWVTTEPTNNGFFTIFTHKTDFDSTAYGRNAEEMLSSYLTLGGLFWLRHRRWSKFSVGVAEEDSITYGGRMLGLYTQVKGTNSNLPEEPFATNDPADNQNIHPNGAWLKPLQLRAFLPVAATMPLSGPLSPLKADGQTREKEVYFSREDFCLDAPIWVEILNRTHRSPQLAYVLRVRQNKNVDKNEAESKSFVTVRTGRDLAEIMRVGLNWRTRERKELTDSPPRSEQTKYSSDAALLSSSKSLENEFSEAVSGDDSLLIEQESDDAGSVDDDLDIQPSVTEETEAKDEDRSRSSSPKKRKFMGKLAHTVKSKTASTGKAVVRGSVKVGKGTMSVGKAIIPLRSMNPPVKEPSQKVHGRSKRHYEKDFHAAVGRSMRRIEKVDSRASNLDTPLVLAGELAATEQSARTVSNMLAKMSNLPRSSEFSTNFNDLLSSVVASKSEQDDWFLQGGAVELGVPRVEEGESLLFESVVARCIWDSHWREEWCIVCTESIKFYAPNTKESGLEVLFDDVRCLRELEKNDTPLPGFPILVIETAWMCHYLAFSNQDKRDTFQQIATRAKEYNDLQQTDGYLKHDKELRKVRFWQGFKSSVESSLGNGKWAAVSSLGKQKSRTVLNNRRMTFDLPVSDTNYNRFVEDMLVSALSFSLDSLLENPEDFVKFMDKTSFLKVLRLETLDLSSACCFCLFVNIYHCLLQHALLLTINGPLKMSSCTHFMRTTCYEIGGDVFSLAELQCYVIRGGMSKPSNPKAPYIEAPRKSSSFAYYTLGYTSPRIHFVLNTGDVACPQRVIVLRPESLEEELNIAAMEFVKRNVKINESKRTIFVPKVCDVYRHDFGFEGANAAHLCLQYCIGFMEDSMAARVQELLRDNTFSVRFRESSIHYHPYLRLETL